MEDRLVKCMMRKDLSIFKQMIKTLTNAQVNACYVDYNTSRKGTLIEFAVEENLPDFVAALLEVKADPDVFSPSKGFRPIHEAAEKGHFDCLKLLLGGGADINARAGSSGRTALHELIAGWTEEPSYHSCFNELMNHPKTDINIEDDDECTPLEIAAMKRLDNVVKRLHGIGATVTEGSRAILQEAYPDLLQQDMGQQQSNNNTQLSEVELSSELAKAVRKDNVEQCRLVLLQAQNANIILDLNKSSTDGPTYLQIACEAGYAGVVEILLSHGASPEATSTAKPKKPILLACSTGNVKILQLLLARRASINEKCPSTHQSVLHEVTLRLQRNPEEYLACLQSVLGDQTEELNINAQDHVGNTALHFAVLSGCQEAALLLLRHGADISVRNEFGISPLKRIHPQILEAYLDECIKSNRLSSAASDFVLSFDYSFLSAPFHTSSSDVEDFDATIFPEYPKLSKKSEIEILREIASTRRLQPLLRHPVIRSFVAYKWFKIRWAFWLNCGLFFVMILLLTGYVVLLKEDGMHRNGTTENPTSYENGDGKIVRVVLGIALAVFAGGLMLREMFQMSIDFQRYKHSFENYVEITLIALTFAMLATSNIEITVNFAAVAIVLAWLELLLLVGRYPEWSTYIAAFVTVSKTFLIMLLGYSLLIIGFALSFYVLGVFDDPADVNAAQGIKRSIMKCYIMMTGELDYDDQDFQEKPWISKGVFLFFVFLVTIILLNLLNALAVSDTQIIKNKTEIVIYASHIEMISYFESMFLRRPFPSFRRKFATFRAIFDKCFLPIRKILNPKRVLVFDRCLPNKCYQVYPNTNPESRLNDDVISCKCHSSYRIDQEVLCEALEIFSKNDNEKRAKASKSEKVCID